MQGDSSKSEPSSKERRFRSAPEVWQDIIKSIINETYAGEGITYAMIDDAAAKLGHSITRDSLRVKMARYIKSGYVRPAVDPVRSKRVRGAFWVTEKGKEFFGLKDRPKKQKTTMLPTSSSQWSDKALKIKQAALTAVDRKE